MSERDGFTTWLEAWTSGFNAHTDKPELAQDGLALFAAATEAWENSGGQRAKRLVESLRSSLEGDTDGG